jgi:nitrate/TMAO reductase-like tetraheme cytochrome c subunit
MRKIFERLRSFFFPPPDSGLLKRLLPYITLGVITVIVGIAGTYAWDYTNSPEFCGTVCHTMPPEYTAYLVSPHARVDCVECHIGRGFIATRVTRKAGDIKHIFSLAFRDYEFPIEADDLRPARETCERCHFPEKFSDDSLREITHYSNDHDNTPITTYLTLKTGGGTERQGLGRGIHWHIENQVLFYTEDSQEQSIPFVRVVEVDGSVTDYVELGSDFSVDTLDETQLLEMDCITCHNRITHMILPPAANVDQLISRNVISSSIPEIRSRAVDVLSGTYDSNDLALNAIAGLAGYYDAAYPEFYAENQELIDAAIAALQDIYEKSVFREQRLDWTTHPNNVGHENSPGCLRCHDGKHLNPQGEAIRLECNLCHSIPVVVGPTDIVALIEISRGPEPENHLNTNWIALHRDIFDTSCANCHSTEDPGGVSNTSFCSNSACHGVAWPFAGFDAPGLREILLEQLPETPTPLPPSPDTGELTYVATIGPLLDLRCSACHGPGGLRGFDVTSYEALLAGGESGAAVILGNPDSSLLVLKQTGEQEHPGQFTAEELAQIIDWIAAGAPEQ